MLSYNFNCLGFTTEPVYRLGLLTMYDQYLSRKEARKCFDKTSLIYDQAREKFLSLRKSTRMDMAASIEEELNNARSLFEQARFNLVSALSDIEAKKKFENLEAVSGVMDAHLRYFKQGYEWNPLFIRFKPFVKDISQNGPPILGVTGKEGISFLIVEGCCITIANHGTGHLKPNSSSSTRCCCSYAI